MTIRTGLPVSSVKNARVLSDARVFLCSMRRREPAYAYPETFVDTFLSVY